LAIPLLLLGISHIVQQRMWFDFFERLAEMGRSGVLVRTFLFELWPATLIVIFHQDWSWPGLVITLYGHLLMLKVALSLTLPELGLKSLQQAQNHGERMFVPAGLGLIALGVFCTARASSLY